MSPAQDPDSFYILGAVVVEKAKVFSLRNQLREIVGDDYFHATELGRKDYGRQIIRKLAALLAHETKPILVVMDQLKLSDRDAEVARDLVTRRMFEELSQNQIYLTGTVIYERRMRALQDQSDRRIFSSLRRQKLPGSKLNVIGVASKQEPLLWAPDLVCWAFRQAYREQDASYFQQLKQVATIIRI